MKKKSLEKSLERSTYGSKSHELNNQPYQPYKDHALRYVYNIDPVVTTKNDCKAYTRLKESPSFDYEVRESRLKTPTRKPIFSRE